MASNETLDVWSHPVSEGLRSLFYIYSPAESSFEHVTDVPKYVTKATPYFLGLVALEMLINLIRLGGKLTEPRWNDSFSSLAAGMTSQLPMLLIRPIEVSVYMFVYDNLAIYRLPWDSAFTWWLTMIGVDLGYYWVHRMAHEINFMWAAHQVHHSSEDYNLTTALRQSVLQRYSSWMFYLPLAFFIPPSIFVVHVQFNLLYQFWIHTETIGKLPAPFEYILNTASHHRVHHGRNRYCIDKNYAGVLIIWDRMFGTFEPEDDNDEIAYGLVHPLNSWDPIYTQFCHWKFILRMAWRDKKPINKVWRMLKGPGWRPGRSRLGDHKDLPDVHGKQPKYDSSVPLWQNFYLWMHFGVALFAQQIMGENREDFSDMSVVLVIIFIMWTLTNIGYFYEKRWYAPFSEVLRCAVYLAVDAYLCGSGTCSQLLYAVKIIFVFSIGIWGIQCLRGSSVRVDVKQKKTK